MRLSKKFSELLLQYKAASRRAKSEIFQKMKKNATNFADWTMIYQYGDDTIRKDAQRKMEKLVLSGKTAADIQLNILELFLMCSSLCLILRFSTSDLAILSSVTAYRVSPASGTSGRPKTSTGIEGPAFLMALPLSSYMALTLPIMAPHTTESPCLNVPL